MEDKYLVSYSPLINNYVMIYIGGEKERLKMQQYIKARGSDEIIQEVSYDKYQEIYDSFWIKHILY